MEYTIGKRYKWNPYVGGKNLWKNGILLNVYEKTYTNGEIGTVGIFVTRDNEEWELPLFTDNVTIEKYK